MHTVSLRSSLMRLVSGLACEVGKSGAAALSSIAESLRVNAIAKIEVRAAAALDIPARGLVAMSKPRPRALAGQIIACELVDSRVRARAKIRGPGMPFNALTTLFC